MKVYFKTVGCRVNQVESQSLAEKLAALGYEPVSRPDEADLVVVNSCSVTEYADRDSLNFIRKTAAANPKARLVVTGCLATLAPEKILRSAPGAEIFPNKDKEKIPGAMARLPSAPDGDFFRVSRFSGRTRAFIKLQDGCDLKCAYCLVPAARSEIKSKPFPAALEELGALVSAGFRELVLCGTRLGMYKCPVTGRDLAGLMNGLFGLPGDFRVRFSSLEPMEVSEALAEVLCKGGERFCDYFHLPLQAGSDAVLAAMGRPYTAAGYMKKLEILRKNFKEPGLFADVIAGFPAETEEQFARTLAFVEDCRFSGLHIFRFSSRPGTRASALTPLPAAIVRERAGRLRALDAGLRASYAASMRGRSLKTLVLKNKGGCALGLASNFLNVGIKGEFSPGSFVRARITGSAGGVCSGDPVGPGPGTAQV
ncbi:MAG: MiaB/RimO family radical SAM methylthiotransferase [Elusimicrobiales bacterium]|jgi:threonylcarbamoyladenosine tRNA methylthiotransferase MtaB